MNDERFRTILLVVFSLAVFYVYYRNMQPRLRISGVMHDSDFPACPVCKGGFIKE